MSITSETRVHTINMAVFLAAIVLVCNVALLSAAPSETGQAPSSSPCPDIFKYGSKPAAGSYEATLLARAHHDLHGVWIRLIFDKPLKSISVSGNFEAVKKDKSNEYLIKNPNLLLKSGSSESLKLTIHYEGTDIPSLQQFRINAVTVCPSSIAKYFLGDKRSEEYLESITTPYKKPTEPNFTCGTIADSSKPSPPWHNGLFVKINETVEYVCDAVLVSDKHFLTAAHCVSYLDTNIPIPKDTIKIYFGSQEAHPVSNINIYPGYNPVNLLNDIALFELEKPVSFSDTIRPICLGNNPSVPEGIISGFINVERVAVKAEEINRNNCLKRLPKLGSILGDDVICAEYLEANPKGCVGQSGGGFASLEKGSRNTYELKGIIIAGAALQGKKECNKETTVILADTSKYHLWILENVF